MLEVVFTPRGLRDYSHWREHDRETLRRVNRLIQAVQADPFAGIGKPEPLRHAFRGSWSRRIDQEHRLVYRVQGGKLVIVACRYHYS